MKKITYILILLFLTSCGKQKVVISSIPEIVEKNDDRPIWIKERPLGDFEYIGIGAASKVRNPDEYMKVAKNNALSDLSSEIKVTVQSNSFLYVLDRKYKFDEEFSQGIQTFTDQNLEGFEFVDSYETEFEYWVYYRLNRALYKENFEKRRQESIKISHDLLNKGQEQRYEGNVEGALSLFTKALGSLREYWGESNKVITSEGEIFLENEILFNLQEMMNDISLQPATEQVILNMDNDYRYNFAVHVIKNGNPLKNAKLDFCYPSQKGLAEKHFITNENGMSVVQIEDFDKDFKKENLEVEMDLEHWLSNASEIEKEILKIVKPRKLSIPILLQKPTFFFDVKESNLGSDLSSPVISNVIKNGLTKRDFKLSNNRNESDLIVQLSASTEQAGTSYSFHVAHCDMEIKVLDKKGNIVYQNAFHDVKGLNVNFESAGIKALSNVAEKVKKTMIKDLINSVL
ncbi:MAG: LPP20 family lipoprotein [Bacteroidota bacterium]